MSHELSIVNGRAELVLRDVPAWHGLGTVVAGEQTIEDCVKMVADWDVVKVPAGAHGIGTYQCNKSCFVTMRTDTGQILGSVGRVYRVIQNREAFSFLDKMHQDGVLYVESMGVLRQGEVVWALVRFPDFQYVKKDEHASYLMLRSNHDGVGSMIAQETDVRIVCRNTMQMALNGGFVKRLTIPHRGKVEDKLEAARELFGFAKEHRERHYAILNKLANRNASIKDIDAYIEGLFPDPLPMRGDDADKRFEHAMALVQRRRHEVRDAYLNPDSETAEGTWYGAVNAVTRFVDHREHSGSSERFFESTQWGSGADLKQRALLDAQVLSDIKI